ncbi:MAG: DUF4055 domain-containing protein [Desulfarculaceae bacterium]|nr:DUF4055 domain-containing protein [Desulfarculaceae bacterium]MCF8071992.1 DUF4055 domain-containing protein [Desulfarculaceae bacterium]MCF8101509.1 DUF4055 domain-containing protein [Desulfarculaceae bacterium]MCF8115059.1 DUF4055 domain-containing protein [Desulfarculaceae bacterium]
MRKRLDRHHPHYKTNEALWRKLRACHEGSGVERYLRKHPAEGVEDFAERKAATTWRNFPRLTIDLWLSKLLERTPARALPSELAPLVADVDRRGTPAGPLFKGLAELALTFGVAFAMVDAPALPEGKDPDKLTLADARAYNLRPYVRPLSPLDVIDWAFDQDGRLAWLAERAYVESDEAQPFAEAKPQEAVRIWWPHLWQLWGKSPDGKLEPLDDGTHPFGQVPVVPWYAEKTAPLQGKSPLTGIVDLSLALMNVQSLLGVALGHAGLPRLVIYADGDVSGMPMPSHQGRGLQLEPGDKAQFVYLPADSVKALQIEADRLKADIRATIYRQVDMRRESAQAEAAEKTRLDLSALHATLSGWAANFEEAEAQTWRLMAKGFTNCNPGQVKITYHKCFDLRTAHQRLQEALEAEALDLPSPTFRTAYRADLVKGLLEDAPPELVAQVVAELEAAEAV